MSSTLGMNRLNVTTFGELTEVPNNNYAKLMYYLHCVSTVIDYDNNSIINDYQHYYKYTNEQLQIIYELAKSLHPSIFINAKIFIVDPNLLPGDLTNQFYKITDERIGIHIDEELMLAGKVVKVKNVMACNDNWLENNYFNPIYEISIKSASNRFIYPVVKTESPIYPYRTNIITNAPVVPVIVKTFKTEPISFTCWFCKSYMTTVTKSKINGLACCCCTFFCLFYSCFQLSKNKSICCMDVIHSCPNCGRELGRYRAC